MYSQASVYIYAIIELNQVPVHSHRKKIQTPLAPLLRTPWLLLMLQITRFRIVCVGSFCLLPNSLLNDCSTYNLRPNEAALDSKELYVGLLCGQPIGLSLGGTRFDQWPRHGTISLDSDVWNEADESGWKGKVAVLLIFDVISCYERLWEMVVAMEFRALL